jgi:PleD family two-component response regulator
MLPTTQQDLEKSAGILIIDDCPEDRETYVRLLTPRQDSARVFVAEDAEDGLTILDSHDIDCILLDYNLPDADGIDLVLAIRNWFSRKEVGIIVISGIGNEQVVAEAFKAGADDYFPKSSITRAKIRRAVDEALLKARRRRTMDAPSH